MKGKKFIVTRIKIYTLNLDFYLKNKNTLAILVENCCRCSGHNIADNLKFDNADVSSSQTPKVLLVRYCNRKPFNLTKEPSKKRACTYNW